MLREISEEVRVALKDRLRDVRRVIRQNRHDSARSPAARLGERFPLPRPPFPAPGVEDLVGHAVSAFDDAMTLAERLVPIERPEAAGGVRPRSFAFYFRAGESREGARAFRRDLYYLARSVLAKRGVADARIGEAELADVHAVMRERHGALIAALSADRPWPQRVSAASAFCAALLVELLDHRPIRFDGDGRGLEILCLASVVLACGFVTVEPGAEREPGLDDLAILAAEARLDRIVPACRGADGQEELMRIFAVLLAHVP